VWPDDFSIVMQCSRWTGRQKQMPIDGRDFRRKWMPKTPMTADAILSDI